MTTLTGIRPLFGLKLVLELHSTSTSTSNPPQVKITSFFNWERESNHEPCALENLIFWSPIDEAPPSVKIFFYRTKTHCYWYVFGNSTNIPQFSICYMDMLRKFDNYHSIFNFFRPFLLFHADINLVSKSPILLQHLQWKLTNPPQNFHFWTPKIVIFRQYTQFCIINLWLYYHDRYLQSILYQTKSNKKDRRIKSNQMS